MRLIVGQTGLFGFVVVVAVHARVKAYISNAFILNVRAVSTTLVIAAVTARTNTSIHK